MAGAFAASELSLVLAVCPDQRASGDPDGAWVSQLNPEVSRASSKVWAKLVCANSEATAASAAINKGVGFILESDQSL